MNAELMQEYEYLWKRTDPNWVLLRTPDLPGGFCVFNKLGSILLIEDDEVNEAVCKRMIDAGCEVLESVPKPEVAASPGKPSIRR
jgi:hypothetical protein